MSADPLVRTARMWGLLSVAVIAIGCAAAAWLLGAPGFYGVLLGLTLPTVFFGLTLAVALGTRARSGGVLGAVILGSWLVKLVLLIVALAVLKPLDFYNRPLFGAALLGWTAVLLGVEVRVIKRTNQPYVEPISPVGDHP